ncbi:MAG: helix-turn-helix domain-containing protein [Elusimicrobiaceae bacterium]|nr:helix-turn-helix domain-containing protein [Elusimicrobiaceae bacterium]MBQ6409751.1 helix-turn-helix domain-containing protein [Candidatus Saccharibacteria bacterium]
MNNKSEQTKKECPTTTVERVAEILHISTRRVCELAKAGAIPGERIPGTRRWVFAKTVVAQYAGIEVDEI